MPLFTLPLHLLHCPLPFMLLIRTGSGWTRYVCARTRSVVYLLPFVPVPLPSFAAFCLPMHTAPCAGYRLLPRCRCAVLRFIARCRTRCALVGSFCYVTAMDSGLPAMLVVITVFTVTCYRIWTLHHTAHTLLFYTYHVTCHYFRYTRLPPQRGLPLPALLYPHALRRYACHAPFAFQWSPLLITFPYLPAAYLMVHHARYAAAPVLPFAIPPRQVLRTFCLCENIVFIYLFVTLDGRRTWPFCPITFQQP